MRSFFYLAPLVKVLSVAFLAKNIHEEVEEDTAKRLNGAKKYLRR